MTDTPAERAALQATVAADVAKTTADENVATADMIALGRAETALATELAAEAAAESKPVNVTLPVITGTPTVGSTLTVSTGTWSSDGETVGS